MLFENKTTGSGKYYLYQYIRLDKNEIFYVGIGTRYKGKNDHCRARWGVHNHICRRIMKKSNYRVEIIDDSDDYNYIKQREVEIIRQYGRISNKTGCLANLTDGGDGTPNCGLRKKCYAYTLDGKFFMEFESLSQAANYFNTTLGSLYPILKYPEKRYILNSGYQFRFYKTEQIEPAITRNEKVSAKFSKAVIQLTREGEFVREWKSALEAARELGIMGSRRHICDCCLGARKTAKGFKWEFKKNIS